jgi:hypothetical protein
VLLRCVLLCNQWTVDAASADPSVSVTLSALRVFTALLGYTVVDNNVLSKKMRLSDESPLMTSPCRRRYGVAKHIGLWDGWGPDLTLGQLSLLLTPSCPFLCLKNGKRPVAIAHTHFHWLPAGVAPNCNWSLSSTFSSHVEHPFILARLYTITGLTIHPSTPRKDGVLIDAVLVAKAGVFQLAFSAGKLVWTV